MQHRILRLPSPRAVCLLLAALTPLALLIPAAIVQPSVAAAAGGCTVYASPSGSAGSAGASLASPTTLAAAAARTQPGSVVCLLAGAYSVDTPFQLTRSGSPSAWVTFRGVDGGAVLVPRSGAYALLQVAPGVAFVEVSGLQFDGRNVASTGLGCKGAHHVRFVGNVVRNTGAGGIATYRDGNGVGCDYVTVDGNQVHHAGYNQGWSSGISLNSHRWADGADGFHSVVVNNLVAGTFDASANHSDGNGIIVDNQAGHSSPPALVANNVVYNNGGRCIHSRYAPRVWVVGNTCYKNGLDLAVRGGSAGNNGEVILYGATDNVVANNVAVAWGDRRPYSDEAGSGNRYYRNTWLTSGSGRNFVPAAVAADAAQLRQADPRFVDPPAISATAGGQQAAALAPWQLGGRLGLQAGSPAIDAGVAPDAVGGASGAIASGLRAHAYRDVTGKARPQAAGFDLAAYEYGGGAAPPPTGGAAQATLAPVADAYVDSANPASNFGRANPLASDAEPSVRMIYLKFDLSSLAGKTVTSASLRLPVADSSSGTHNLRGITSTSWTETGLTWNNRPALGAIIGRATSPATNSWIALDVTGQVRARAGQAVAFALDTSSGDGLLIRSRESAAGSQPQLIVK